MATFAAVPWPSAVIAVDGVLRWSHGSPPIPQGRRLYRALAESWKIILAVRNPDGPLEDWLLTEGFTRHDHLVDLAGFADWPHAVNHLRSRMAYDVDLVVTADPADAVSVLARGRNTLLFSSAAYGLPEWRPDADMSLRPWDDLASEIDHQARMRAGDERLEEDR